MSNRGNNERPDVASRAANRTDNGRSADAKKIMLHEADGAQLTPAEFEELINAQNALSFLQRVRLDLAEQENKSHAGADVEDHISTLTDQNTLADQKPIGPSIDETFGRFKILETIGQGGFARVFRAHDPVLDREVALKIPRPQALISDESAIRFRREARAAAMLSHPAIVPVLESGEVGLISYIASGYCHGETLAAWFKKQDKQIDSRTAVSIVARLADAVEHAHQRGVVHRDLKPANILLDHSNSETDIADRLQITDFGLAKQLDSVEESLTLEGAVVGTPAYMSPEQACGSKETDAATDIYSLGVILFELLSSNLPFNKASHLEMLKAVESEPAPVLARVKRSIPRDLSAICQKCLSKSPADRYPSAFDLASDLNAWLENRPVKARPVTVTRRLYQWYTRNTALACALSFAFVSLVAGLAVSLWQWDVANANAERADLQLVKTTAAKEQSQNRLVQIERSFRALAGIFDDLNISNVEQSAEPLHAVLANRLISVGKQLDDGLIEDPLVEADMKTQLADSLIALGFAAEAIPLAKDAVDLRLELLGENNAATASSICCLADAYSDVGKYDDALKMHQRSLDIRIDVLGEDNRQTLGTMNQVAGDLLLLGEFQDAIELYESTLVMKGLALGERDPSTLTGMSNLASGYLANGQYNEARPILEKTWKLREQVLPTDHPDTLSTMDQLARCLLEQNEIDEALPLLEETLERRTTALGPTHKWTLVSIASLASGYGADGQLEKALPLFEKVLQLRMGKLGGEDPVTIASINDLGTIHMRLGNFAVASPLLIEARAGFKNSLTKDHPVTLVNMQNLATCHFKLKQYDEAFDLLEEAVRLTRAKLDLTHPDTISGISSLASLYSNLGRYEESIEHRLLLIEALTARLGADDPKTLEAIADLGDCYAYDGQYDLAINALEPVLLAGDPQPQLSYYRSSLRYAYAKTGRREEFQGMADEDLAKYRGTLQPKSVRMASKLAALGTDSLAVGNYVMASALLSEALSIRELEGLNVDVWRIANNKSVLGAALMNLENMEDAEPLLTAGYEGLVESESSIHPKLRAEKLIEAAQWLIEFYDRTDENSKAESVRMELEQIRAKYDR